MQKRIEEYNYAMFLRKKEGLGKRRLHKKLKEKGYDIPSSTIQQWLNGRKPTLKEFSPEAKILTKEKA